MTYGDITVNVVQEADGKAMKGKRSKEEIQQRNKAVSCSHIRSLLLQCPAVCAAMHSAPLYIRVSHLEKVYVKFAALLKLGHRTARTAQCMSGMWILHLIKPVPSSNHAHCSNGDPSLKLTMTTGVTAQAQQRFRDRQKVARICTALLLAMFTIDRALAKEAFSSDLSDVRVVQAAAIL